MTVLSQQAVGASKVTFQHQQATVLDSASSSRCVVQSPVMILYVSPFQERQAEALRQRLAERGAGRVTDDVTPEPAVDIQQLQQVSLYIDDKLR